MPNKTRATHLVQQLKKAIEESGLSLQELSKRAGVAASQLSHFMRGERTLTLPVAGKVCEALGYQLMKEEPPAMKKRAGWPKKKGAEQG